MEKPLFISSLTAVLVLFSACTTSVVSAENAATTFVETRLELYPQPPQEGQPKPELDADLQKLEDELWERECVLDGEEGILDVAAFVAKPLIRFVADKIDERLQKELQKYTASYEASSYAPLYTGGKTPLLALGCFQFTRILRDKDELEAVPVVAVDLIGKLETVDDTALVIRPLRLYFAKPAAITSSDNQYGIALGVSGDVFWRDGRTGKKADDMIHVEELISAAVGGDAMAAQGNGVVYYRRYAADTEVIPQPLPPWSEDGKAIIHLTVSAVEVGSPNVVIKHLADLFHSKKDDIVGLLEKAADKAFSGG